MKKNTLALSFILILSLVLAGCGTGTSVSQPAADSAPADASGAAQESIPDTAPVDRDSVLIMATEAGFKPYEYYEGDQIVGVDVDIAKEIAAELGRELLVEDMAFDSIIPAVNSGKADFGAAGMSVTPDRLEQVNFTIEYATSKQVIMTRADSGVEGEADLNGKVVGVQLGTVADLALTDDYPEVTVQQYNKYFEAANDLLSGRLDAIVLDVLPAQELVKTGEGLVILEKELFTDVYAFCVSKENAELLDAINAVMQRLMDEGKIEEFTTAHSAD